MVKYTQTMRRLTAGELFECVWPFCVVGTWMINNALQIVPRLTLEREAYSEPS